MFTTFYILFIMTQAPAVVPQAGQVAGYLRLESGLPAAGFRVGARPVDQGVDVIYGLTATDSAGRFVLVAIPPGRYHIVAGSIERPTFYPGTEDDGKATAVTVEPNGSVSGIDFTLLKASVADPPATRQATLPMTIVIEGGGPLPATREPPTIQLINKSGNIGTAAPLSSLGITMTLKPGGVEEYRVQAANLPPGYVVKSAMFRSRDLAKEPFKFSLAELAEPALNIPTFSGRGTLQDAVNAAAHKVAQYANQLVVTIGLAQP